MERHDIKPDWTIHNGGFGGKVEPTEPEPTETAKETEPIKPEKPVKNGK